MITFRPIELSDSAWMRACVRADGRINCEYSFGNIFTYAARFPLTAANCCGCLVTKCELPEEDFYCFPVGNGARAAALQALIETALAEDRPAVLYGMNADDSAMLHEQFHGRFLAEKDRGSFDYVYNTADLTTLSGKKYQAKRNHISFFLRNTRWTYEKITAQNAPECLAMSEQWLLQNESDYREDLEGELKIIRRALENFDALGYVGGLLRADGRVIAYTMGEALNDEVFCVHFEKAFPDIRGAYPAINQMFVQQELQTFRFINREDDVDIENLRRAKESYHPAFLIEKYEARLK